MKIVVDTNIVVSSILFGGKPKELLMMIFDNRIETYVTKEIVEEYKDTIEYLRNRYKNKKVEIPLANIVSKMKIIESKSKVKICRDPDDDKFINCAIDANAIYIVSGDKDLLVLKKYKNIKIITVAEFLNSFNI